MAACPQQLLHGGSPPPFTFNTSNLKFLPKIWLTSVVHGPAPFEDPLNSLTPICVRKTFGREQKLPAL